MPLVLVPPYKLKALAALITLMLNHLDKHEDIFLSEDKYIATVPGGAKSWYRSVRANKSIPSTGKWVWEVNSVIVSNGWYTTPIAIALATSALDKAFGYDAVDAYGISVREIPQTLGIFTALLNMDARTLTVYRNGVLFSSTVYTTPAGTNVATFPPGTYYVGASLYSTDEFRFNFGQTEFAYPGIIPAGYNPLPA